MNTSPEQIDKHIANSSFKYYSGFIEIFEKRKSYKNKRPYERTDLNWREWKCYFGKTSMGWFSNFIIRGVSKTTTSLQ